jgi:predicted nuclease of predicted toxin-antitoxin system
VRFKLDENLPYRAADTFGEAGHDADTVYDEDLAGQPDEVVLAAAFSENRVLVTLDLDFSDLRAYPIGTHCGIVVLRPLDDSRAATHATLMTLISAGDLDSLGGALAIVTHHLIRIRRPPP